MKKQLTSASDRASAIRGGTPPSRPIAMLMKIQKTIGRIVIKKNDSDNQLITNSFKSCLDSDVTHLFASDTDNPQRAPAALS